ncbi:MAG: DUF177 domain-containing protein [Clostridia bacterium]|nr:DUF177 domain-containing protein [Clostridia bacterium]
MILDLRKLKRSGKDQSEFFFEYTPQTELVDLPSAELITPVKVQGSLSLTGEHSAYVEGEIVFGIKGECTRCLKDTEQYYSVEFAEMVEVENQDGYSVINDTVNLAEIVDDVILINQPITFLCKEDCKGICVGCGVNLNDGECKCKK